jgi:hypothetical protein
VIRHARGFLAEYKRNPMLRHLFRASSSFCANLDAVSLTRPIVAVVEAAVDAEVQRRLDIFRKAARYAAYCELAR